MWGKRPGRAVDLEKVQRTIRELEDWNGYEHRVLAAWVREKCQHNGCAIPAGYLEEIGIVSAYNEHAKRNGWK